MTHIEAMKQALEALEDLGMKHYEISGEVLYKDTFTSLRQAITTEESLATQEPVAWLHWLHGPVRVFLNKDEAMLELDRLNRKYPVDKEKRQMRPLVFGDTHPQPKAEQEPCAMRYDFDGYGYKYIDSGSGSDWKTRIKDAEPVFASPQPQKPWVGLTDEEKKNIFLKWYGKHWAYTEQIQSVMASVEAKLKDKNHDRS